MYVITFTDMHKQTNQQLIKSFSNIILMIDFCPSIEQQGDAWGMTMITGHQKRRASPLIDNTKSAYIGSVIIITYKYMKTLFN